MAIVSCGIFGTSQGKTKLIRMNEALEMLSIGRTKFQSMVDAGMLKKYQIEGVAETRYRENEVLALVSEKKA